MFFTSYLVLDIQYFIPVKTHKTCYSMLHFFIHILTVLYLIILFQNRKLYKKIHIFMCVKEERCGGRWETLLFQPNGLGLTHISVSIHCSVCVHSLPKGTGKSWATMEGHFKITPAGEEVEGFGKQVCWASGVGCWCDQRVPDDLPERQGAWQCLCMNPPETRGFRCEIQGRLGMSGQLLESCTAWFCH